MSAVNDCVAAQRPSAIRVNAGGDQYTDSGGNVWSADAGFTTGVPYAVVGNTINNTADQTLYRSERWDSPTLTYRFAVPNGTYWVQLKFAEIYFTQPGQRMFHIYINGQPVWYNFDIVAAAGSSFTAYDLGFTITPTNGELKIELVGVVSNPKLSAFQIVPVSLPSAYGGTTSYRYNGDGQRVGKWTAYSAPEAYAWDPAGIGHVLLDNAQHEYVWAGGGLLGRVATYGGAWTYAHADRQGSLRLLTDNSATVVGHQQWDSFGKPKSQTGLSLPFGYTGEWRDQESGWLYLRARYYDPSNGRFLSRDPVMGEPRYAYAHSNPLNMIDPTGQFAEGKGDPHLPVRETDPTSLRGFLPTLESSEVAIRLILERSHLNLDSSRGGAVGQVQQPGQPRISPSGGIIIWTPFVGACGYGCQIVAHVRASVPYDAYSDGYDFTISTLYSVDTSIWTPPNDTTTFRMPGMMSEFDAAPVPHHGYPMIFDAVLWINFQGDPPSLALMPRSTSIAGGANSPKFLSVTVLHLWGGPLAGPKPMDFPESPP